MLVSVTSVTSTSMGDDCGEGFRQPGDWAKLLASRGR